MSNERNTERKRTNINYGLEKVNLVIEKDKLQSQKTAELYKKEEMPAMVILEKFIFFESKDFLFIAVFSYAVVSSLYFYIFMLWKKFRLLGVVFDKITKAVEVNTI